MWVECLKENPNHLPGGFTLIWIWICHYPDNSSWESRATLSPMRKWKKKAIAQLGFGPGLYCFGATITNNLQKGIIFSCGCWNFDVKCCNLSAASQETLFDYETLSFCINCNSALVICDICAGSVLLFAKHRYHTKVIQENMWLIHVDICIWFGQCYKRHGTKAFAVFNCWPTVLPGI